MKIIFSILLNASILFLIAFILNTPTHPDAVIVSGAWNGWQTYIFWWVILWFLNIFIKPILKIIWLPLFFIFPIIIFLINLTILWLLEKVINNFLLLPDMIYHINWTVNFLIAVAIFTILNILYSILFSKKW